MRLERHPDHWRLVGGPVPPGYSGMAIGPVVFLRRRAAANERLIRHEIEHVRQWRELGVLGFARRYVGAYLRWRLRGYPHQGAYRRVPLEVEASWRARRAVAARRYAGAGAARAAAGPAAGAGGPPVGRSPGGPAVGGAPDASPEPG